MFALERLVFQGTEACPRYRWKQYALCGSRRPLERVRAGQRRPEDWRIVPLVCSVVLHNVQEQLAAQQKAS